MALLREGKQLTSSATMLITVLARSLCSPLSLRLSPSFNSYEHTCVQTCIQNTNAHTSTGAHLHITQSEREMHIGQCIHICTRQLTMHSYPCPCAHTCACQQHVCAGTHSEDCLMAGEIHNWVFFFPWVCPLDDPLL